jgi:hypothetical protein
MDHQVDPVVRDSEGSARDHGPRTERSRKDNLVIFAATFHYIPILQNK